MSKSSKKSKSSRGSKPPTRRELEHAEAVMLELQQARGQLTILQLALQALRNGDELWVDANLGWLAVEEGFEALDARIARTYERLGDAWPTPSRRPEARPPA